MSCHLQFLLYALALAYLLLQTLLGQSQQAPTLAPLLRDLAPRYAVDADVGRLELHPGGRETAPLPSVVDAPYREAAYYAVTVGRLVLDDKADVGAGGSMSMRSLM